VRVGGTQGVVSLIHDNKRASSSSSSNVCVCVCVMAAHSAAPQSIAPSDEHCVQLLLLVMRISHHLRPLNRQQYCRVTFTDLDSLTSVN